MKTEFTKGEWEIASLTIGLNVEDEDDSYFEALDIQCDDKNIVLIPDDVKEYKANAKLIAAAPELLEFAIEMVRRYPNSPWIHEQGGKAIKKATE